MKDIEFDWPILGQERIKTFLQKSLANEAFSHAYLFLGPENIGKTKTAKLMAESLLCHNFSSRSGNSLKVPCGECAHCQQFEKGIHPDVYFLELEKKEGFDELKNQISVKQVRGLQSRISKHAFLNSYKVVIAPRADFLTAEAQNSLLKTLEEPARKTVLFLIADSRKSLLDTIASRCQIINFNLIGRHDIYDYLLGHSANRDQAKDFSKLAFGRPTRAMKLFSHPDDFASLRDSQIRFLESLDSGLADRFIFAASASEKNKEQIIDNATEWQGLLRDVLLVLTENDSEISNRFAEANLRTLAGKYRVSQIRELIARLEKLKLNVNKNINIKLMLENFFLTI
ncbi:MAG: ATP-binding protein [Patescibacteria group bacterium]